MRGNKNQQKYIVLLADDIKLTGRWEERKAEQKEGSYEEKKETRHRKEEMKEGGKEQRKETEKKNNSNIVHCTKKFDSRV